MISDHASYLKIALFIGNKDTLSDDRLVGNDKGIAQSKSVWAETSLSQISNTCKAGVNKSRNGPPDLYFKVVSPPLAALIGETIAARLISRACGLVNIFRHPQYSSPLALFCTPKTKGRTSNMD